MTGPGRWRPGPTAGALGALVVGVLAVAAWLHRPMLADPAGMHLLGAFHDGHVWGFDRIAHLITGQEPFELSTPAAAFPGRADVRLLAWIPAIFVTPLNLVAGPLVAYNAAVLLTPVLSALGAWLLFRRLTGGRSWVAAAAALSYALCPFALGSLANGQVEKANHWVLPLFCWSLWRILQDGCGVRNVGILVLVTMAGVFTEPTLALLLPFAAVAQAFHALVVAPSPRLPVLGRSVAAAGLAACALLPAWLYFTGAPQEGATALEPGTEHPALELPRPSPLAQPEELLWAPAHLEQNPELANHVTYLGLALFLAATVLSVRRFPARGLAWAWVGLGVLLALGPRLASGGQYVLSDGRALRLPAWILEQAGYPLAVGGMYYRAVALASLGLSSLLAGGASVVGARRPGRVDLPVGAAVAWVVCALALADGIHATARLWPRPAAPVPGRALLQELAGDSTPGAVLDLPLETDTTGNGAHLLAAVFHRRPTTALASHTRVEHLGNLARVEASVQEAARLGGPAAARSALLASGYRCAIWRSGIRSYGRERSGWTAILGNPVAVDGLFYWDFSLGQTSGGGEGAPAGSVRP